MPNEFLHEELSRNITKILDSHIVIFGCGAIGANLAISLARRGFNSFSLIDRDRIVSHNISTQPWTAFDEKRQKVDVLAQQLLSINKNIKFAILNFTNIASPEYLYKLVCNDTKLLVDSTDNKEARKIAQNIVSNSKYVLHVGLSAEGTGEVTWGKNYTIPEEVTLHDPCAYPMSRTLIELTIIAAAEAIIEFLLNNKQNNYLIQSKNLKIQLV